MAPNSKRGRQQMAPANKSTQRWQLTLLGKNPRRARRVLLATAIVYGLAIVRCAFASPVHAVCAERTCGTCCQEPMSLVGPATTADDCCDESCACCRAWVADSRNARLLFGGTDSVEDDTPLTVVSTPELERGPSPLVASALPSPVPKRPASHSSPNDTRAPPSLVS